MSFGESKLDARLREKLEEGSGVFLQEVWGLNMIRTPRIARAVSLALLVVITSGCAERKPSPEKLFELRAKCDKMVREKIEKVEDSDRYSQVVTSHLTADLRCYGKEELTRYDGVDGLDVLITTVNLIDGLSGTQLRTARLFEKTKTPESQAAHFQRLEAIDKMMDE